MTVPGSVVASVEVPVDPATAFVSFTDEIDRWYVREPHSWKDPDRALAIRIEPWVGGRMLEVYDLDTLDGFAYGTVRAWEPGRRLVLEWALHDGGHRTEVEVRFDPAPVGTRVTIEHRGWDRLPVDVAAQGMANVRHGWPAMLSWLREYLEKEGVR